MNFRHSIVIIVLSLLLSRAACAQLIGYDGIANAGASAAGPTITLDPVASGAACSYGTIGASSSVTNATGGLGKILNSGPNEILTVVVSANRTDGQGSFANVTGITGGSLTFAMRSKTQVHHVAGAVFVDYEVWWAYSSAAQVNTLITASTDVVTDSLTMVIFGAGGFTGNAFKTNPWDANVSLPKVNSGESGFPTISGINTSSRSTLVVGFLSVSQNPANVSPSPFVAYCSVGNIQGNISNAIFLAVATFSSRQTGLSNTWSGSVANGFIEVGDALANGS